MINRHIFKIKFLAALYFTLLLGSCASKENLLYLQDKDTNLTKEELSYEPLIQNDDILQITVTSVNMAAVAIFNQNLFINNEGALTLNPRQQDPGYIVDGNGDILFLELGKLKVAGKTRLEVIDLLEEKLAKFVIDPLVDVRIINFKITVLGEVTRPGTFPIRDNRVSVPQALGLAGDLTIYGDRKTVMLLRDVDGVQVVKNIDLTSSDFITSETYFLKQNDVLIVSPNKTRQQASKFNQNASLYVSLASLLLTSVVIILNASK